MMSSSSPSTPLYPREEAFFSFCPVEFMDNLYESAMLYINQSFETMEDGLRQLDPTRDDLEKKDMGTKQFFYRVRKALDTNFDKFEVYCLRNLFLVPPEIELSLPPKDKDDETTARMAPDASSWCSSEKKEVEEQNVDDEPDEEHVNAELALEQSQVAEQVFLNAQLRTDLAVLQRKMQRFDKMIQKFDFMDGIERESDDFVQQTLRAVKLDEAMQKMEDLQLRLEKTTPQRGGTDPDEDEISEITRHFLQNSSQVQCQEVAHVLDLLRGEGGDSSAT